MMKGPSITSVALSDYAEATLRQAVADMRPGWIVLRDCALDTNECLHPARVQYALIHAEVGIALLDVIPGSTIMDAAERLNRLLDTAGFYAKFLFKPEIRYFCIPLRAITDLGQLLEQEFSLQTSGALLHGKAWTVMAQRLLLSQPLNDPTQPESLGDTDLPQERGCAVEGRYAGPGGVLPAKRRSVPPLGSVRWLSVFWGLVATTIGGGVLLLQHLGPPAERAGPPPTAVRPRNMTREATDAAPALHAATEVLPGATVGNAAQTPLAVAKAQALFDADLQRAMLENDNAIVALERRLKQVEPKAGTRIDASAMGPGELPGGLPILDQVTPDRVLLEPARTFAGHVEDQSVLPSVAQDSRMLLPSAPSLTATMPLAPPTAAAAPPTQRPVIDAPLLPQVDDQAPTHATDGSFSQQATVASSAVMAEPAATSPNMPLKGSPDAAEAVTAIATVVPANVPKAGQDLTLVQNPSSAPDAGVPTSTPEPVSTTKVADSIKTVPLQGPAVTLPAASPATTLSGMMIQRAAALLQRGDISAARLLYARAAAAGSGHAATAMGKTYDATFLAGIGITGVGSNPALAIVWYRRGLELGDAEAHARLEAVPLATSHTIIIQDRLQDGPR